MKFQFFNDTGKPISIHPGSAPHNCEGREIKHLQMVTFELPDGTSPFVKMWDYSDCGLGLSLFVQCSRLDSE